MIPGTGGPLPDASPTVSSVTETDHQRAIREARLAIEIVTMWMPPAWGHLNPAERLAAFQHVDRVRATEDAETIFSGQLTLTMLVLRKLAEARGATEEDLMDEVGNILQEISRELQE